MATLRRLLGALPWLLLAPIFLLAAALALALTDLLSLLAPRRRPPADTSPDRSAASVVIPNWNGRDLLERYLPSVVAAMSGNPRNEIIVVDNASTDGSRELLRERFPGVRVLALERNEGFGGGSNAGFAAARNDIVVLLNSDMRVQPDFLPPLVEHFADPQVFAVGCQIFFSDPARKREETGLTQVWWQRGRLRVRHREDARVARAFPCAYGGGGSCAFDRRKFLELGGFDPLLAPFYLEDTDAGYLAWKRGWKVLYEPRSIVFHEHRGTIGRKFSAGYIESVLKKNFLLFAWKNIHEWRRLGPSLLYALGDAAVSAAFQDSPERSNGRGIARAAMQLPGAVRSRWKARTLAVVNDTEALRRPLGGYFRDRFGAMPPAPERLRVLFVSPYPICPPVHGGGVFMYGTTRELAKRCDLHLIVLLDRENEREAHAELSAACRSAEFLVRMQGRSGLGSALPHSVLEFRNSDLEWIIHRQIFLEAIDVLQLEYMPLGQYTGEYKRLATVLFEHDIYFQSVGRQIPGLAGAVTRLQARYEYLRALRYELKLLPRFDRVQVCSSANRRYIESFLPQLAGRIDHRTRAGIDVTAYDPVAAAREPDTMLFVGSFRHQPNQEGIGWFTRRVLPKILEHRPGARLVIVGAEPPPRHALPPLPQIEVRGYVADVREPLSRYSVFLCPILSGSGVRVKLLEAFAAGIPVVSTPLGAEGLTEADGEICALAEDPDEFAARVLRVLTDTDEARRLSCAARRYVTEEHDVRVLTSELEQDYRSLVRQKRAGLRELVEETPVRRQ